MRKIPKFTVLLLSVGASFCLPSCDSDGGSVDKVENLPSNDRGLEVGVDSLPYRLNPGDRIEFDDSGRAFELGTFYVTNATNLRQGVISTDPEWEVHEETFLYTWEAEVGEDRPLTSVLSIAPAHLFSREGDFVPAMDAVIASGGGPGSLAQALSGGDGDLRDQRIVEAISSIGILAVEHPDFGLCVRRSMSVEFENPVVTIEEDGSGKITGDYTVNERWQSVVIISDEDSLGLDLLNIDGADIIRNEETVGTFTYYFNDINQVTGFVQ